MVSSVDVCWVVDCILCPCSGRACSLHILLVNDHSVVLLVHDVLLTLHRHAEAWSESASVINELKLAKYVGDKVHVRHALVIRTDNKPYTDQCTVAVWVSSDDLCILLFHLLMSGCQLLSWLLSVTVELSWLWGLTSYSNHFRSVKTRHVCYALSWDRSLSYH